MSLHKRYMRLLMDLLPSGAFGLSVALAASATKATPADDELPPEDRSANTLSVATELQMIRDAVDEARAEMHGGGEGYTDDPDIRLAWWANGNGRGWGNGGRAWVNGGYPAWANARPWANGWGNGGWFNAGPWRNGGPWGNGGWHNGGRPWGNGGWHNWRNAGR